MKYAKLLSMLLALWLIAPRTFAQQAVNVQDSLALVDFYDSTNGPSWENNFGWKQGPVSSWYGVTVAAGRVTGLSLEYNNLSGSVPQSFGTLTKLQTLNLGSNQLTALPESFGNLTNLKYLDLHTTQLRSLPESFGQLTKLQHLSLEENAIHSLPESFGNLTELRTLSVPLNGLTSLPESFGNLKNLQNLDLDLNHLTTLPESFGNLKSLQNLDLLENYISSLPESFGNLTGLQSLNLINNQLRSLPASFSNLTGLQTLGLAANKFSSLPESIGNLTHLQDVNLSYNQLRSLPASFGKLTNLQILGLGGNQFSSLPESIGKLTKLRTLLLEYNQLSSLSGSIGNLIHLQTLSLNNNQLTSLPQSFGNLGRLKDLSLGHNQLTSLPASCGNLKGLQSLDISYNHLRSLPASLGNLKRMQNLLLGYNQLTSLPQSISYLDSLQGLWLSYNKLTFADLEWVVQKFPGTNYYPQDNFKLTKKDNMLIAPVGGTPENNTFNWFQDGQYDTTIQADSTYMPKRAGRYRVGAHNSLLPNLTLISELIDFAPAVTLMCPGDTSVITGKGVCTAVVNGVDPIVLGATMADVRYSLSGATKGSDTGTASGKTFNKGVTTVAYTLIQDKTQACSFKITIEDKEAPVITSATATPETLWPPNHKLATVRVNYDLTDNCGTTASLSVKGHDGTPSADWKIVDAHHVLLRSERTGSGKGRTYTIIITARDASGNKSTKAVNVIVPHDQSQTVTWYRDADGDGWGNPQSSKVSLTQPRGYVSNKLDCDDKNKTKGGPEVCDGIDNDCDGIIDNGFDKKPFYSDWDHDGYGSPKRMKMACAAPSEYVSNDGDCNDDLATVYPGAPELCDGRDNDCNGTIDEGLPQKPFYWDHDKDGYGFFRPVYACAAPPGYISIGGDFNDNDTSIHPGAVEHCDGVDEDCDGVIDNGFPQKRFYKDNDGDGWGSNSNLMAGCAPRGYVERSGDCNDHYPSIHPGAKELPGNGFDDNCNGQVDEVSTCPFDIVINSETSNCGAVVNWKEPPLGSTCASPSNLLDGFTYIGALNGHAYYKSKASYSWKEANAVALSLGGHMATITSQQENDLIYNAIAGDDIYGYAIGLTDTTEEGHFTWITGEPLTYTNWYNGEPNNGAGTGEEDYTMIYTNVDGWNDYDGIIQEPFILEFEPCPSVTVTQVSSPTVGLHSGSFFPVGTTTITYTANDAQDRVIGTCAFKVIVKRTNEDGCGVVTQNKAVNINAVATGLQLMTLPNPSTHYFNVRIQSSSNKPVQLRIFDEVGRLVEAWQGIMPNSTLNFGNNYRPGFYFVEAVQERKRTIVKVVKTSQ